MSKECKPLKMLAVGDVRGRISDLLQRFQTVNRKAGPFDMAFCTGSFFNEEPNGVVAQDKGLWNDIKSGKTLLPFPVYILGPVNERQAEHFPDLNGAEIAENLVYLGRGGCLKTNEGLTIAYISGTSVKNPDKRVQIDTDKQMKTLQARTGCLSSGFKGVDILMTSDWPSGISNQTATPQGFLDKEDESARNLIARLALELRPRYHFAGTHDCFYERLPYRNHRVLNEQPRHTTRFIGLAEVGNLEKKKWIYAFNITPLSKMSASDLTVQPPNTTESPFKQKDVELSQGKTQLNTFFFSDAPPEEDRNRKRKGEGQDGGGQGDRKRPALPSGPCWFCLSGAEVEKHLVVSIGVHSYVAMAKGGMTPQHVMILPISHHASWLELPEEVAEEIDKFKSALKKCFKKALSQQTVFFERNYRSQHLQIQVIAVPKDAPVALTFKDAAEEHQLELVEVPEHSSLSQMAQPGTPYFYAEASKERLFHRVRKGFPIQFGREVVAHENILNLEDRIDWRECKVDRETETEMTLKFRALFKPFDFTLDEEDDNV